MLEETQAFVLEETQALMGATRLASGIEQLLFSGFCVPLLFIFPTRDASPPLEVAFVYLPIK